MMNFFIIPVGAGFIGAILTIAFIDYLTDKPKRDFKKLQKYANRNSSSKNQ